MGLELGAELGVFFLLLVGLEVRLWPMRLSSFCRCLILVVSSLGVCAGEEEKVAGDSGSPNSFGEAIGRQATLEFSYEPSADLDAGGDFSYWDARVSAPVFGGRITDSWFYGFRLRYRLSEFDGSGTELFSQNSLHRIDLSGSLVYRPANSPWVGFLSVGPAMATDGEEIDGDSFLWVGIAGIGYRFSEKFTLLGGGFFSQEFGEPRFLGAPGFIWTPTKALTASLIGPRFRMAYAAGDDWRVAVEAYPDGGRWNIETANGQDAYLDRNGARVGLRLERRVFGNGWLFVGGGYMVSREIEVETVGGESLFASDADSGLFFNSGFTWRF